MVLSLCCEETFNVLSFSNESEFSSTCEMSLWFCLKEEENLSGRTALTSVMDAKANINMQSNKETLDDTVSVTKRHFSGLSLVVKLAFPNPSARWLSFARMQ